MYPTTHGHTGAIITTVSVMTLGVPIGLPFGLITSFLSHFVLDYLNEYHYGDYKRLIQAQLYSVVIFALCCFALFVAKNYIYLSTFILGYLAGNLPDIIDKKIAPFKHARPKEKRFSCHNGNGFLNVGSWKFGIPTKVNLSKSEQAQIQFIATVLITILTIYILK